MEKQLNELTILATYQHRQVILNYYQNEDMLYERDGFHFQTVEITATELTFTKKQGQNYTIKLNEYPEKTINTDFQNYYILRNQTSRIEIYFP